MFEKLLKIFLVAMLPLIEIRGAMPYAQHLQIPFHTALPIALIGNLLPVPFIYLFAHRLLVWGQDKSLIGPTFKFFLERGKKAGDKLQSKTGRGIFWALFLFVAIPLPGTGAWTGTLGASILAFDFRKSIFACMAGVIVAGLIMYVVSLGVFSLF